MSYSYFAKYYDVLTENVDYHERALYLYELCRFHEHECGVTLDLACGTPEFAPPTIGVVNRTKRTPAFDYGSLGLVVYYLATGRSYFSGMSSSAIAESWMKGIQIPAELDTRIKMLLEGLLVSDEKLRYSYLDVRNWYKGSFVQVKKDESVFTKKQPQGNVRLWFGIFDGQSIEVSSIPELVQQMKQHWQQAGMKLTDTNFYNFLDKASGSPALSEAYMDGFGGVRYATLTTVTR